MSIKKPHQKGQKTKILRKQKLTNIFELPNTRQSTHALIAQELRRITIQPTQGTAHELTKCASCSYHSSTDPTMTKYSQTLITSKFRATPCPVQT